MEQKQTERTEKIEPGIWILPVQVLGKAVGKIARCSFLSGIPLLDIPDRLAEMGADLISLFRLPPKAYTDASHLGLAILHRMDYLLTWNCTHLANAVLQKELLEYCQYHQLHVPIVCTPHTLTLTLP